MADSTLLGANWRTHLVDKQTSITDTNETQIITVSNAHYNLDLYFLVINNRSASDTDVTIRDGTGGTVRWKGTVKAGFQAGMAMHPAAALKQATPGLPWTAQCSSGVNSIEITAAFLQTQSQG